MRSLCRALLECLGLLLVLVGPRSWLHELDRAAARTQAFLASATFQKLGPEFQGYASTEPQDFFEPWCCERPESSLSDDLVEGGAHVLYAASSTEFGQLSRSVLSLALALNAEDTRAVTIHWVVPAEDMEQAQRVQDCLKGAFEDVALRPELRLHEAREHFGRLEERAQARAKMSRPLSFVKFYMYEYLPSVPRAIWLDPETIVQADVRSLFSLKMSSAAAVTCHEGWWRTSRAGNMEEFIGLLESPRACYLHSGVILANLTAWKALHHTAFLEMWMNKPEVYMQSNYGRVTWIGRPDVHFVRDHRQVLDQTAMNLHFQPGMIDILDQRWNVFHTGMPAESTPPMPPCCEKRAKLLRQRDSARGADGLGADPPGQSFVHEAHSRCAAVS